MALPTRFERVTLGLVRGYARVVLHGRRVGYERRLSAGCDMRGWQLAQLSQLSALGGCLREPTGPLTKSKADRCSPTGTLIACPRKRTLALTPILRNRVAEDHEAFRSGIPELS